MLNRQSGHLSNLAWPSSLPAFLRFDQYSSARLQCSEADAESSVVLLLSAGLEEALRSSCGTDHGKDLGQRELLEGIGRSSAYPTSLRTRTMTKPGRCWRVGILTG